MTAVMDCPRCHNATPWKVQNERVYFSLFFIPVFPYKNRHILSCPVCREGREITTEEKDRLLQTGLS